MNPSEFGGLAAAVDTPYRMTIVHPATSKPITTKDGSQTAYVDLLSLDSAAGRKVAKERSAAAIKRAARLRDEEDDVDIDPVEQQVETLTAVTVGWLLIDPTTGQPLDYPWSPEAARHLWSAPEMAWLRRRAYVRVIDEANFLRASSAS